MEQQQNAEQLCLNRREGASNECVLNTLWRFRRQWKEFPVYSLDQKFTYLYAYFTLK